MMKLVIIAILALSLEAGIVGSAIKKVTIDKAKDMMVDKAKDKAKTKFKEKVMNNPNVKKKMDTTLTNLENKLNGKLQKQLQENQAKRLQNERYGK